MALTEVFDVAVIGAGPAGSSAAYHLARRGRRVLLLERSRFPRDKACGDGLGRASVALLSDMGLEPYVAGYQRVGGVRIVGETFRETVVPYPDKGPRWAQYGAIVPRRDLDHLLAQAAVAAGAELWQEARVTAPVMRDGSVTGVVVRRQGIDTEVATTFAVAADGALSPFARAVGLTTRHSRSMGFAVRGYFTNTPAMGEMFNVYFPILDPNMQRALNGYGWVFPLVEGCVNVGVGYYPTDTHTAAVNLRRTFEQFVEWLRVKDPRLRDMRLAGRLSGAPVPCAEDLPRCAGRGTLLVGDAAGLVDPFTGEGIGAALESGKLAAEVLDGALATADPMRESLGEYDRRLDAAFTKRFETSRRLVGRSWFLLRLLENTLEIERPVFRSFCTAVIGGHDSMEVPGREETLVDDAWLRARSAAGHVARVRHLLSAETDEDFPLLSQACAAAEDSTASVLRMHLVFVAAHFGVPDEPRVAAASAAIELANLALLMHGNVLAGGRLPAARAGAPVRWGNIFAVTAGDYLLARAHGVAADLGAIITGIVSEASARAYVGRLWEAERAHAVDQSEAGRLDVVDAKTATLFALACRIGARLGGADHDAVERLAGFGRSLGIAFALIEEVREITVDDWPGPPPVRRMLEDGLYSWPAVAALRAREGGRLHALLAERSATEVHVREALALLRRSSALPRALDEARRHLVEAERSLAALPPVPARRVLGALIDFVADRAEAVRLGTGVAPPSRSASRPPEEDTEMDQEDATVGP